MFQQGFAHSILPLMGFAFAWKNGEKKNRLLVDRKTASGEPEGREGVDLREERLYGILHVVARFEDLFYM